MKYFWLELGMQEGKAGKVYIIRAKTREKACDIFYAIFPDEFTECISNPQIEFIDYEFREIEIPRKQNYIPRMLSELHYVKGIVRII